MANPTEASPVAAAPSVPLPGQGPTPVEQPLPEKPVRPPSRQGFRFADRRAPGSCAE
jgi:hypothetical protein